MATMGSPPASPTGTVPLPRTPRARRRSRHHFNLLRNLNPSRLRHDLPLFSSIGREDAIVPPARIVGRNDERLMRPAVCDRRYLNLSALPVGTSPAVNTTRSRAAQAV